MNQWIATHAKYTDKIASDPLKWEFSEWLNLDNYLSKYRVRFLDRKVKIQMELDWDGFQVVYTLQVYTFKKLHTRTVTSVLLL
jgi:hypothetical protein